MGQGHELLTHMTNLGKHLHRTGAFLGQDVHQREVDNLHADWTTFTSSVGDVERNLESCISNWMELDNEHLAFSRWLDKMDRKLKDCLETKADLSRKRFHLQEGEVNYILFLDK